MRKIAIVSFLAAAIGGTLGAEALAQEGKKDQYERWRVAFGPLTEVDGDYRFLEIPPGLGIAYPKPEDGMMLKCRPEDGTQYCILVGVRKRR